MKKYTLLILAITFTVLLIRLPALGARTIHIDEGMGIRASELMVSGEYVYSPYNGHGPTLFYFGALVRNAFGTNIIFFRCITILFMLLSLLILWLLYRKELNNFGKIILLAGFGLSSGMLFFLRLFYTRNAFYFAHCFGLGLF
jgi:predicted membrane-bound mannosyltransferase